MKFWCCLTLRTHLFLGDSCHLIARSLGPLRKCSNCGKSSPALASPYHIHDDITSCFRVACKFPTRINPCVRPTDCRLKVEQKCNSHKTRDVSRGGRRRHNWWFIGSVLNLRRTHTYTHRVRRWRQRLTGEGKIWNEGTRPLFSLCNPALSHNDRKNPLAIKPNLALTTLASPCGASASTRARRHA